MSQWAKDPKQDSLYEFSSVVSDSTSHFAFIEETIYPLLEKSCVTGCFANGDMSSGHKDIGTCPKKSDEQSLKFQVAKLPHYYLYKASSAHEADNLLDLIAKLRVSTKGCHYGP